METVGQAWGEAVGRQTRDAPRREPALSCLAARAPRWLWASGTALFLLGLRREGRMAKLGAAAGLGALAIGVTRLVAATPRKLEIVKSVTVNRPRHEVYERLTRVEDLPELLEHMVSVVPLGGDRWRFRARATRRGPHLEWDAELIENRPGERLIWQSIPEDPLEQYAAFDLVDAPGDRGTEIHAKFLFRPRRGRASRVFLRFLAPKEDLRRLKQVLECGEVPTTRGQPSGRLHFH